MKVLNLCCSNDHRFEGWFASMENYQSQSDRGLIECPLCGNGSITRLPNAPHIHVSSSREVVARAQPETPAIPSAKADTQVAMQSAWMQAVRHVMANTDDVGERFAEEARRMHYGEIDERAIRGRTTGDEARALLEEGIAVMPLPLPAALKEPLQ